MTLKFDIREDMSGYSLHVDTAQSNIEIGATEAELRRLLIDLLHEFDVDVDGGDYLATDGGQDFDPSELDVDEPPEPDPPMYEQWEDVEVWTKGSLRYPIPGGWDLADHGKFHTTWKHEDGTKLTRSFQHGPGEMDTFAFKLDGEEIHRVDTGPKRVEMREETVWLLQVYDENDDVDSVETFEQAIREERNQSLDDFVTDGGTTRPQTYRDVEIPDAWHEWPEDAKVNYLSSVMDRDQLLETVGELAGIPDGEIGEQSIWKSGLAQLVVVLERDRR